MSGEGLGIIASIALAVTNVVCPPVGLAVTGAITATSLTMVITGKATGDKELERAGSDLAGIVVDSAT